MSRTSSRRPPSARAQDGQFIQVKDAKIEPEHALIYSVKGQFYVMAQANAPGALCFVNFNKIGPTATAVNDRDVLMFGRTIAKFWLKGAPASGGSLAAVTMAPPGGGAEAAKAGRERDEARTQLTEARAQVTDLQQKLTQAQAGAGAAGAAQAASLETSKREKDDLAKQLEARKREVESANKNKDSLGKEIATLKSSKKELEGKRDELEHELKMLKDDRELAKKTEEKVRSELADEKKRAVDLEADLAKLKPEVDKAAKELDAVRKALEALRTADLQAKRDRRPALREGSDVAKALEALGVPDQLRARLTNAVRDEVDREVLSREGPVVQLRGLHCPGCDADLEAELGGLKARRKQREALRALGAADLSADEVKALVDKVRSRGEPVKA